MSDANPQSQGQYGGQTPPPPPDPKSQYGGQPKPSPCADPKPPDPKPPDTPKCPPVDACPEPKPCPDPPTRPPDPCEPVAAGGASSGGGSGQQTQAGNGTTTPAEHLAALKQQYDQTQQQLQNLEPLKNQLTDLSQRIQAFEKTLDGQSTNESSYKDFYKSIDLLRHDIVCFIPTARCQLELTDRQKQCICDAIAAVDARVDKARKAATDQKAAVDKLDGDARKAARDLEWTKKWYDYLKTNLQQQVSAQRDDVKKLKGQVTPSANPCEAFFYLYELERLIQSAYGKDDACWKDDIGIATYLDCWPWENYSKVWNKALVDYNKADAADKLVRSQLDQARKLLVDLDKAAADAVSKRREWVLKEIKSKDCCGPLSKCP